jgi:hypothetical protein
MKSSLQVLFERDPTNIGNTFDLEKQIAQVRAQRAAEQQARMAALQRREQERAEKAAARLAERQQKAAARAAAKAEKARLEVEAKAGKPDPRQIDLEDWLNSASRG